LVDEAGREKVVVGIPDPAVTDRWHGCGMSAALEGFGGSLGSCTAFVWRGGADRTEASRASEEAATSNDERVEAEEEAQDGKRHQDPWQSWLADARSFGLSV
jgi:hypothetical protein